MIPSFQEAFSYFSQVGLDPTITLMVYCISFCDICHACHYLSTSLFACWELSAVFALRFILELELCSFTWWVVCGKWRHRFLATAAREMPFPEGEDIMETYLDHLIKSSSPLPTLCQNTLYIFHSSFYNLLSSVSPKFTLLCQYTAQCLSICSVFIEWINEIYFFWDRGSLCYLGCSAAAWS